MSQIHQAQRFRKRTLLFLFTLIISIMLAGCGSSIPATPTAFSTTLPVATVKPTQAITATIAPSPSPTSQPTAIPSPIPTAASRYTQALMGGVPVQIYIPEGLNLTKPVQLMLVLHGMGGAGEPMIKPMIEYAEQYKWVILAPTFRYNPNWQNPQVVAQEDPLLAASLSDIIDQTAANIGIPTKSKILLYGFSRGAQLAHRFAMMYPEKSLVVATISAGSYTLPFATTEEAKLAGYVKPFEKEGTLPFPFGVGDLSNYIGHSFNEAAFKKISFWVEVGGNDTNNADVPRAYDSYLGNNRVERAQAFYSALKQAGISATLTVYPGVAHATTNEMQLKTCKFFKAAILSQKDEQ